MVRAITAGAIAMVVAAVLAWGGGEGLPGSTQAASVNAAEMAGAWTGEARIAVNWTTQRTLRVQLAIAPDGRVAGTIGDATLRNGRLESNRTAIGRALHIKTDWIVRGDLEGDVIKAENVRRDSVTLPMNWVDGTFEGSVHTSGSHIGGKQNMWLAAHDLRLYRAKVRP